MPSHPRGQASSPDPKPLGRASVELVPCELVNNDSTTREEKAANLIEDNSKAPDVVQREARNCDIETPTFIEIFDPTAAKDATGRGLRIDCDDVIPSPVQCSRKPTVSASYFQDASRRTWQL